VAGYALRFCRSLKPERTTLWNRVTVAAVGGGSILECVSSALAFAAAPECSAAKLQGQYVFNGQGTKHGNIDLTAVEISRAKQTSIRQTRSPECEGLQGTYTLNADYTGARR
jgi:hypothetical protein